MTTPSERELRELIARWEAGIEPSGATRVPFTAGAIMATRQCADDLLALLAVPPAPVEASLSKEIKDGVRDWHEKVLAAERAPAPESSGPSITSRDTSSEPSDLK